MPRVKSNKGPKLPDSIELTIDKLSHDGRGIGRYQGRVVMVDNALPHEKVRVRPERGNTRLWQGRVTDYIEVSSQRQTPPCKHYGQCGGCQLQHLSGDDQITLKQQAVADHFRRNGLSVEEFEPILASSPFGYRHRARFHVSKKGQMGFHGARGQQVVVVDQCPVLTEPLQSLKNRVQQDAPLVGIQQLELVIDDKGQAGAAVIKASAQARSSFISWLQQQDWLCQSEPLQYQAGTRWSQAAPGEFTQVNRGVNKPMLEQIGQWLGLAASDRLLDLFCGNGNISLALADQVEAVLGLESSAAAVQAASGVSGGDSALRFVEADLFTENLQSWPSVRQFAATVAVLDPPRAGAEQVCRWLSGLKELTRLVYVSCDPATLARDLAILSADNWHLRKAGLIDMFPQTRHIETMVLLEKE